MDRIAQIRVEIDTLNEKIKEVWSRSNDFETYRQFEHALEPYTSKCDALDRELRMLIPAVLSEEELDHESGSVMSLADFIECVKEGGFIDYDGFGSYVKDNRESNISIYPSDIDNNVIRPGFDTIIWYNR